MGRHPSPRFTLGRRRDALPCTYAVCCPHGGDRGTGGSWADPRSVYGKGTSAHARDPRKATQVHVVKAGALGTPVGGSDMRRAVAVAGGARCGPGGGAKAGG